MYLNRDFIYTYVFHVSIAGTYGSEKGLKRPHIGGSVLWRSGTCFYGMAYFGERILTEDRVRILFPLTQFLLCSSQCGMSGLEGSRLTWRCPGLYMNKQEAGEEGKSSPVRVGFVLSEWEWMSRLAGGYEVRHL